MLADFCTIHNSCYYLRHVTESETKYIERIYREHHTIINTLISGPCKEYKKLKNIKKNRFPDIKCWDATRVCFSKKRSNYIHANYVHGFERPQKFIVTQEPMNNTLEDYWTMVWEAGTKVIVMLNGADAPSDNDYSELKTFTVSVDSIVLQTDYVEIIMNVFNVHTLQSRIVHFFKYLNWPKGGVTDILPLISFLIEVNERQQYFIQEASMSPPGPIVVYSSTGTGRAATFCVVDVCMTQLVNTATISIPFIVFKIRQQRHSSIESLDNYFFINNAVIYFLATIPPNSKLFLRLLFYHCDRSAWRLSDSLTVQQSFCLKVLV
uniref:Protein tyrosine phosphatase n=1 Tax=Glyptapanteles flavicoxis TaxID=463051 RepID=B7S8J2_9HYME|nr:protein tyrosine phosphatase [Glyptapanteles flavicoxis]